MSATAVSPPRAILFDRDGTLVTDVPYNPDPAQVRPVSGARAAVESVRAAGLSCGVLTNQSGIGRGLLNREQVDAVNARIEELLGPFDVWEICPHHPDDGCRCRKPEPGMILAACRRLGLDPSEVAYIGDIGADIDAATAAGATGVLVPTPVTRREEVEAADLVAENLAEAISLLLEGRP
ncbi:D-glycero-alpha-D-manno-heptose-1,7-bisphosphate 7-phosphatase [Arthrobacter sulfonylureivorans]|uniref:D-glycero-alpha-D-manno-heptose-1,7-bisphosphate 7-phosphatase n=1 Tax=Arthrobacter sulfonylureivorans TaxID=2486855 RepID=UPI0039E4E108